jgi:hypothetical protein
LSHLKVIALTFALLVLLGTLGGAFFFWKKIFQPEIVNKREIRQEMSDSAPKSDPGKTVYEASLEAIRAGQLDVAREKLRLISRSYTDSEKFAASRRILGEMNLDRLFSRAPMPGKLEYTVGRDSGLETIAKKGRTTVPFIRRTNGLSGTTIHPGDRLVLYPLDFEVEVNVAQNMLTVAQQGEYFKSYPILAFELPDGMNLPKKAVLNSKPATLAGKALRESDARFAMAKKYLQTKGSPGRPSVIFAAQPAPNEENPPKGIYLTHADLEELATILRIGTPISFRTK